MLLELFPFVILNNAMAFVYAYFFSDFCVLMSLLLLYSLVRVGPGGKPGIHVFSRQGSF